MQFTFLALCFAAELLCLLSVVAGIYISRYGAAKGEAGKVSVVVASKIVRFSASPPVGIVLVAIGILGSLVVVLWLAKEAFLVAVVLFATAASVGVVSNSYTGDPANVKNANGDGKSREKAPND